MTTVGIEKEVLHPLSDIIKSSIVDVKRSPVENFSFAFLSSPTFLEYLYRIIYFTESVESAEQTVWEISVWSEGCGRREISGGSC